jgi:hypothetical protein
MTMKMSESDRELGRAAAMRGEPCRCPDGLNAWSFFSGYIEAVTSRHISKPSPVAIYDDFAVFEAKLKAEQEKGLKDRLMNEPPPGPLPDGMLNLVERGSRRQQPVILDDLEPGEEDEEDDYSDLDEWVDASKTPAFSAEISRLALKDLAGEPTKGRRLKKLAEHSKAAVKSVIAKIRRVGSHTGVLLGH